VTLVALAAAPTRAYATLLVQEPFLTSATPTGPEYSLAAVAGQNPTSIGFTDAWFTSSGGSPTLNATSLNYLGANYPAETGGRLLTPTSDSRIHRLLSASNPFESTDSGTVYLSFLLQTGSISSSGYRAFEMHNGGNSDAQHRALQIGISSYGDFPTTGPSGDDPQQFGLAINNGALKFNLGAEDSGVHLFLAKFNLSSTNNADSITVWNNPSLANLAADPAGGVTATGFSFAADRMGIGHFTGAAAGLDELRIGTTLADVLTRGLTCDVNGNGVCNSSDTAIISQHMYLPGVFADGDLDGSGTVDFTDFRLFKDHPARVAGFDPLGAGGSNVPEPASLLLLGVAWLCCGGPGVRRRQRPATTRHCISCLAACVAMGTVLGMSQTVHAAAEDLLNDTIGFSGATLNLRPYATLPAGFNNVIEMTHRPLDTRMYVATEQGSIFVVNEDAAGNTTPSLFFNAASALQTATGRSMNFNSSQKGLQSVAFPPDFDHVGQAGYGKLYTTMLENRPANPNDPSHFYLGNSAYGNGGADGVLVEWTYDHNADQVDPNSYRELFRTNMPNYDHPIKLAQFDPYAQPGDEDYGLLYMTHGDSNNQDSLNDDPQDRGDVLGKMLRINPLQSGADRYTIPTTNPFYSASSPSPAGTSIMGEVYAYGFRNPHTFSFNPDDQGNIHILVGDIGRDNIEEVNLVKPGNNYGWTKREGTFVHLQKVDPHPDSGYISGVADLPANEATVGVDGYGTQYTYPVAQWDHNGADVVVGADWWTGNSIATSFVIQNGSDPSLDNQFIHLNFASNHGDVYQNDFDAILNAVTQLDASDPLRDEPSELTQAVKQRLHLTLDGDSDPNTPPTTSDNINSLLGVFRNDVRFGEGISGEMYLSNKNNGGIYLATNTVPDNRITLTVDRESGGLTINNSTGSDVDLKGLRLFSPTRSLDPTGLQGVDNDWTLSTFNSTLALSQQNAASSFELTGANSVFLGNVFEPHLTAFGESPGEDLQFVIETAGVDGRRFVGDVVYTGVSSVANTIVLTVDLASGKAVMLNQTPFTQEVEGYTISSVDGSIDTAGWNSLEAQGVDDGDWLASPAIATRLTEIQDNGTTTFDNLTPFDLGSIFQTGGGPDLILQFLLAGDGSLRTGQVVYILAGDYNGDDVVNAADYTVWRNHFGTNDKLPNDMSPGMVTVDDYNVWTQNFGAVLPAGAGGAAVVPEPASWLILMASALAPLAVGRARKSILSACRPAADL
jgi:hypothetical protein